MEIASPTRKPEEKKSVQVNEPASVTEHQVEDDTVQKEGVPLFLRRSMLAGSPPPVQRQPLEEEDEELLQAKYYDHVVQRDCDECSDNIEEQDDTAIQTKLIVGPADDEYEREADAVADAIVDGESRVNVGVGGVDRPTIHRSCSACGTDSCSCSVNADEEQRLYRKASATKTASFASASVSQRISEQRGRGKPLPVQDRSYYESRFARDLSQVRIHDNNESTHLARDVQAHAFTLGNEIFFGSAGYDPGNQSGRRLVAHELTHVVQQTDSHTLKRDDDDVDTAVAETKAREVYDALNWLNATQRALSALAGHGGGMRGAIRTHFLRLYDRSLRSYLISQLDGDDLVRAYALLHASNSQGQHVAMALALIPLLTRDDEVFRLLYGTNLDGRHRLEEYYNGTFGRAGNGDEFIGYGTLKDDLIHDLSGWREQKSLALLNRDLTEADELYFDSVGINGTHEERVVSRLQRLWDTGPQALMQLKTDWNTYIKNDNNWSNEQWSTLNVRDAMDGELSGEYWELVRAILDGLERYETGTGVPVGPLSEEQNETLETNRLQVAEDTLDAATTGGYTGSGTNEEQVYRAVRELREIYMLRIERARESGDEQALADAQQAWETRRLSLVNTEIPAEMNEGTSAYIHTRLLLRGNLTRADELYIAGVDFDYQKVSSLVSKTWVEGGIEQLHREADRAVLDGTTQLRPSFDPNMLIPITRGHDAAQVIILLRQDYSNVRRGSERIRLEVDDTASASALDAIKAFLSTPGLSGQLRTSVITNYVFDYVGGEGSSSGERFITHLRDRYGDEPVLYDIQDIVDPVVSAAQAFERASARYDTANSGVLNFILNDLVTDYDVLSGEDTQAVTLESLERLRYLSEETNASLPEIQAMMQMAGVNNLNDLATTEYRLFRQRLDELRAIKRAITEAIATAVQLAIETVATILTAGAAGPMLLASLGATLAAIVVREALLGDEYRTMSEENLRAIAMVFVSHGAGAFGRNLFAVSPERLRELSRIQVFLLDGAQNAVAQVGIQTVTAAIENRAPTSEAILASAISIIGSSTGAGLQGSIAQNLSGEIGTSRRLRQLLIANMAGSVVTANSDEAANMVRTGVDDFNGPGIASRFLQASGRGIVNGVSGGVGQYGAEVRSTPSGGEEENEARREEELEEGVEGSRRLPEEGEVDVAAATDDEPGILAAAPVNDAHTVSVIRDTEGNIATTLCSPVCGHLRLLLRALQEDVGSGNDSAQGQIARGLTRVDEIERRLQSNPLDPEAHAALRALGGDVAALLRTFGDDRIFGTVQDTSPQPLIAIPGGDNEADRVRRRQGFVRDNRFAPGSDTDREWLINNPPPRPSTLPPDQEGLWQAYRDYYGRRLQAGSTDRPPRTWESYRDLQMARMGHFQRGTEFEGRVSVEAEEINAEGDLIVASQVNVSETETVTTGAGQMVRPDQLMVDPADSTGMAVSNKSRTFDDPVAARDQVVADVDELLDKYSGSRFIRRAELAERVGNEEGRINVTEVVLVYDAGAMGTRQPGETDRQFSARMSELAQDIASTARRHAHTVNPDIVFWVTFHDYSGNSPLPTSNDPTARVAEE